MPQGTGIASYGRNLLQAMARLGAHPQILYGTQAKASRDSLLGEIALADMTASAPMSAASRAQRTARRGKRLVAGATARPLHESGQIIWPGGSAGRPPADLLWASPNLFADASRLQRRYGAMTSVHFRGGEAPNLMHWTAPLSVHAPGRPNIYTIHDLVPLKLPHSVGTDKALFWKSCQAIARRADHIATVSESARNDIITLLGVEPSRVTNTYQTVDIPDTLRNRAEDDAANELDANFDLPWQGYLLHFGATEPKKNLGRIVEAYLASGVRAPLVIVGARGWMADDELAQLQQLRQTGVAASERIFLYEYMSYRMLMTLVQGARAVLFPSLYEGFGLPVLEAMALGVPVLTSTEGALPEIASDAAVVVDPYDIDALARGMRMLDADGALRSELSRRGRRRSQDFGTKAYDDRLRKLYAKVGTFFAD